MRRIQGRVTRDDIRSAGLRRWDGRARITTDWVNVFHEPELCWPTGDCLVYLREPGQSSRGPAFRVHTAFLKVKGFEFLVDRCVIRNSIHATTQCVLPNCPGCDPQEPIQELYIPAPHGAGLEDIFDHHITTRNFFAWLYNRPLAGRTLGTALAALKGRIDVYRPDDSSQNKLEVVSYAENQRYLDFRECVDHSLAALYVAETLQIEDLWVDAFAHCVGMSHRGLRSSIEYGAVYAKSKTLINRARLEMDLRLDRVNKSLMSFFENEVSGSFLGLPQPARDHLDRFRSFLKSSYIEQYGSWPPDDFEEEGVRQTLYSNLFADFQNLYQHLVDPESSTSLAENDITKTGGVCILQNIQAFDSKHHYEPLAQPLPLLPKARESNASQRPKLQRRLSWNPVQKRRAAKEARKAHDKQALITASNRDLLVMDCPLVRKYSEFEEKTVDDDLEGLSAIEGRKVRWILVYAVLQTFHSTAQPPKQVRNTSNLSYSLCCQPPKQMPWQEAPLPDIRTADKRLSRLAPDNCYSHTNTSSSSVGETLPRGRSSAKARRRTLPANLPGSLVASLSTKTEPGSRSSSLRRLMTRHVQSNVDDMPQKKPSFCEIYVEGYGNGLNEVNSPAELTAEPEGIEVLIKEDPQERHELVGDSVHELASPDIDHIPTFPPADISPTTPPTMSRESSSSSISSSDWSNGSEKSGPDPTTPASERYTLKQILKSANSNTLSKTGNGNDEGDDEVKPLIKLRPQSLVVQDKPTTSPIKIVDTDHHDVMEIPYVHFNTQTWDLILAQRPVGQRPMTAPASTPVAAQA